MAWTESRRGGILAERGEQRLARRGERTPFTGGGGDAIGHAPRGESAEPVEQAAPAARGAADHGQEQVVHVHLPRRQPGSPALVEVPRKVVRIAGFERHFGLAADQVVVDGEMRGADRAQHRVAQFGAVIEFVGIRGLEQQPAEADGLHQRAVARLDGDIVDMPQIGQVRPRRFLARYGSLVPGQGR